MRLTYLLFIFCIYTVYSNAQKTNGFVIYRFISNYSFPVEQPAYLQFKSQESVFVHSQGKEGMISKTSDGKDWDKKTFESEIGGWYQDEMGAVVYKNFTNKKMIVREFFERTAFLAEEPKMPQLNWKLTSKKRKIGLFECQKATCSFRGRNYEAWFTTEIPIQDGPWKLQGLPGLILEAYDETKEVQFLFKSVQVPAPNPTNFKIEPSTTGRQVDFETYKRADDIAFEEEKKRITSKSLGRGTSVTITKGTKKHKIELEYEK